MDYTTDIAAANLIPVGLRRDQLPSVYLDHSSVFLQYLTSQPVFGSYSVCISHCRGCAPLLATNRPASALSGFPISAVML